MFTVDWNARKLTKKKYTSPKKSDIHSLKCENFREIQYLLRHVLLQKRKFKPFLRLSTPYIEKKRIKMHLTSYSHHLIIRILIFKKRILSILGTKFLK